MSAECVCASWGGCFRFKYLYPIYHSTYKIPPPSTSLMLLNIMDVSSDSTKIDLMTGSSFIRKYNRGLCAINAINNLFREEVATVALMNEAINILREANPDEKSGLLNIGNITLGELTYILNKCGYSMVKEKSVANPWAAFDKMREGSRYIVYTWIHKSKQPHGHFLAVRDGLIISDYKDKVTGGPTVRQLTAEDLKMSMASRTTQKVGVRVYEVIPKRKKAAVDCS